MVVKFKVRYVGSAGTVTSWGGEEKANVVAVEIEWAGEHFIFWDESFGPLRVNPLFTFNYTAIMMGLMVSIIKLV